MSDTLRDRIRTDALEHAAADAWEHDHPATPWAEAPDSVRIAMRALVRPTVDAVLEHLDARGLLNLEAPAETWDDSPPFDIAVRRARNDTLSRHLSVRYVYRGTPLVAHPGDTWQDVAGRYAAAAEDAAR